MTRGAVISLSHGGGPLPILGDPEHKDIVNSLKNRVPKLLRLGTQEAPRAIVVVTAHWSSDSSPIISSNNHHQLYYDYYNFPAEAYKLRYDAPGSSSVANEVFQAFSSAGLNPRKDPKRGWDHGVFIPMLLINPSADIPVVQVSVLSSEDPVVHYTMGQALSKLRDSNIAILGSGFASLHNLGLMVTGAIMEPSFRKRNVEWSKAVTAAATEKDSAERERKFGGWRSWPGGKEMHPFPNGGEHFMPLIVCAGAGGEEEAKCYADKYRGLDMFSYYWT